MRENSSPWIYQLDKKRTVTPIHQDSVCDVVIVGGGIAGISTAFFILKYTSKKIILCDRSKIGHGATGHNAGQIVSYFERPFKSIVDEFGLEMAARGQKDVEDAWQLLDEMYTDAGLTIPVSRFEGHMGIRTYDQLSVYLEDAKLRKSGGLKPEKIKIALELSDIREDILETYKGLYEHVPHTEILNLLQTENKEFIASVSQQKGVTNSALFVQEVALFLSETYRDRFSLFENTPIDKIVVKQNEVLLDAGKHTVAASKVILCTNGFEGFSIFAEDGMELNKRFHARVYSQVAYMSGYTEKLDHPPMAISYLENDIPSAEADYNYLTRRPFEIEKDIKHNLICIGGPTSPLYDELEYNDSFEYPENAIQELDSFLRKNYKYASNKNPEYKFTWRGLMGYTKNYIRMIGSDPIHPEIMYNLGCNGVGILPSICGAKKISDILAGKQMERSIFDIT